jgi:hypothetical protein
MPGVVLFLAPLLGLWLLTLVVVVGLCTAAKASEHVYLRTYPRRRGRFSRGELARPPRASSL